MSAGSNPTVNSGSATIPQVSPATAPHCLEATDLDDTESDPALTPTKKASRRTTRGRKRYIKGKGPRAELIKHPGDYMSDHFQPWPGQEPELPAPFQKGVKEWYKDCQDQVDKIRDSMQNNLDKSRQQYQDKLDKSRQEFQDKLDERRKELQDKLDKQHEATNETHKLHRQDLAAKDSHLVKKEDELAQKAEALAQKAGELVAVQGKYDSQVQQTKEYTDRWHASEKKLEALEKKRRPLVLFNEEYALVLLLCLYVAMAATVLYLVFSVLTWWFT